MLYSKNRPVKVPPEKCLYKYFWASIFACLGWCGCWMVDPQCSLFHGSFVCVLKDVFKYFFWFGLVFKEKPLVGWLIPSCHCMFRAWRVYAELDAGPWCRFRTVCLAREDVYFGALGRERRVISAGEMAGGRGLIFRHNRVLVQNQGTVLKKVAIVGCTQAIFRLGRVKTSVDQSAALIPAG